MKYILLLIAITLVGELFAQEEDFAPIARRNELSTDLSGAFTENYRLDYNRLLGKKFALAVGLQTRSESAGVTTDTISMNPLITESLVIGNALPSVDVSAGVRWYLGKHQPMRGFWLQGSLLASVADWRSKDYDEARLQSLYPNEYRETKTILGLEIDYGYRHVFSNGISLSAYFALTQRILRSTLQTERFTPRQRESSTLETILTGSFLTVGYVW